MSEYRTTLERELERLQPPRIPFDQLARRRDHKRRNQRIAAGIVGIAVFVAAIWIVTSGLSLDRGEKSVAPAGEVTGPAETGPAETGPTVTAPRETGPAALEPTEAIGPVPKNDYLLDLDTGEMTPLPESIAGRPGNQGSSSEYAASPDGSRLAYAAPGDNGEYQIFVANLDGTGIEQVSHDVDAAVSPVWSPDGSKIAYVGHQGDEPNGGINWQTGNIFVLDLVTGASTQLTFTSLEPDPAAPEFGPWGAAVPSFTPDGSSIVYGAYRSSADYDEYEVRMVPVAGGESVRVMGGMACCSTHTFGNAHLSPDGSLLSYSCGESWHALCIANADGTDERVVAQQTGGAINAGSWSPDGTRIPYLNDIHAQDVFIVDVATGQATYVAEGMGPTWLDDHTLIVEIGRCYNHKTGGWGDHPNCGG
jgi:Tol biopolymer transport system component